MFERIPGSVLPIWGVVSFAALLGADAYSTARSNAGQTAPAATPAVTAVPQSKAKTQVPAAVRELPDDERRQTVVRNLREIAKIEETIKQARGSYVCDFDCLQAPHRCLPEVFPESQAGVDLSSRRLRYKVMMFGAPKECAEYVMVATGFLPGDPIFCLEGGRSVCESEEHPTAGEETHCVCLHRVPIAAPPDAMAGGPIHTTVRAPIPAAVPTATTVLATMTVAPTTEPPPATSGDAARPVKLSDPGVRPPVSEKRGALEYPAIARSQRVEGVVGISALVDERGSVIEANVVVEAGGEAGLNEAALDYVKKWRFRPATLEGVPVKVWTRVNIKFSLPTVAVSALAVKPGDLVKLSDPGVQPPVVEKKGALEYPARARRQRVQGVVGISVLVDERGSVADAKVVVQVGGEAGLNEAALDYVKKWTFRPATLEGVPVKVWTPVNIKFSLQ